MPCSGPTTYWSLRSKPCAATGTSDAIRDRHTDYSADQSDVAVDRYVSDDQQLAHRWVDTEITNLAASFDWACARGQVDAALRLAANTHFIARASLRTETFNWPEEVRGLARASEHRQLPFLLAAACDAATGTGRLDDAVSYGLEAIALNDDDRFDFSREAHYTTGMAMFVLGDIDRALRVVRDGAEHPADAPIRGNLLCLHVLHYIGGIPLPEEDTVDAIGQLKSSPMPAIRAGGFWVRANLMAERDTSAAIGLCQQAIDLSSGSRTLEEMCRSMQLELIAQSDDLETALTGFAHAANTWQHSMGDVYAGQGMGALATWLAGHGYHDGAARLFGAGLRGRPESWINPPPEVVALPEEMGEAAFTAAFEAGTALDPRAGGELAHQLIAQVRADHLVT